LLKQAVLIVFAAIYYYMVGGMEGNGDKTSLRVTAARVDILIRDLPKSTIHYYKEVFGKMNASGKTNVTLQYKYYRWKTCIIRRIDY
jgi:hypothetical protein